MICKVLTPWSKIRNISQYRCSLFTPHCSLLTRCSSLLKTYQPLLTSTTHSMMLNPHYFTFRTSYFSFSVFTVHCSSPTNGTSLLSTHLKLLTYHSSTAHFSLPYSSLATPPQLPILFFHRKSLTSLSRRCFSRHLVS